ncbi:hypothetical protein DHW03_15335 [Pedobacter yonginense]|uniref:IrrE N-terminal-like domain-containing protein n=1 Tax=Pedobacter yonginense TaxID=651869 RepID=A0A317EJ68_9SPHI|nr:hypothetical protein [Pedobacter yonginense]PWS26167.1 hypothetical protein DHW03_15335 [Pedobacter yonginense]
MLKSKKSSTIRELIAAAPDLLPFEQVIDQLLSEFYDGGASIIIDSRRISSYLAQTPFNSRTRNFELFIGVRDRKTGLNILWSIFHEYGHLIQDRPTGEELIEGTNAKYLREIDAWDKAQKRLLEFDNLIPYFNDFKIYRSTCTSSYKVEQ